MAFWCRTECRSRMHVQTQSECFHSYEKSNLYFELWPSEKRTVLINYFWADGFSIINPADKNFRSKRERPNCFCFFQETVSVTSSQIESIPLGYLDCFLFSMSSSASLEFKIFFFSIYHNKNNCIVIVTRAVRSVPKAQLMNIYRLFTVFQATSWW